MDPASVDAPRTRLTRHLQQDMPLSLDELAGHANREHELCVRSAQATLGHALAAGAALVAAREQIPAGEWQRWLAANFQGNIDHARTYVRLHVYRDRIPEGAGVDEARQALVGAPESHDRASGVRKSTHEERATALRLAHEDLDVAQIARHLDKPISTVRYWIDPAGKAKATAASARRRKATQALQEAERQAAIRVAVRKAGAGLAEAYSMTMRFDNVLAQAEREAEDSEAQAGLAQARGHYHRMSDAIIRALGAS